MPFVLDNSVVSGWYIASEATPYTDHVASRLLEDRAIVPAVWELELANVLRAACLSEQMNAQSAQQVVTQIGSLPIEVDRHAAAPSEVLALALRFGLDSYHAAYLELALRLQVPVATQDADLRDAAMAAGVGVV